MKTQTGSFLRAVPEVDERREHQRVEVQGATVDVLLPERMRSFPIDNLSEGGALVAGRIDVALSSTVPLRIHLPGLPSVELTAVVLRHVPRGGQELTAVRFLSSSDPLRNWIGEVVLQGLRAAFPEL